jgi:hypothetical protein
MQLNEKILAIYPELATMPSNPDHPLYILQDDSDNQGPYIKEWNYTKPQPTQEELNNIND